MKKTVNNWDLKYINLAWSRVTGAEAVTALRTKEGFMEKWRSAEPSGSLGGRSICASSWHELSPSVGAEMYPRGAIPVHHPHYERVSVTKNKTWTSIPRTQGNVSLEHLVWHVWHEPLSRKQKRVVAASTQAAIPVNPKNVKSSFSKDGFISGQLFPPMTSLPSTAPFYQSLLLSVDISREPLGAQW